jgi:3-deoxy-D-manno-octulosonate 8-phosphate phosphatase (KDO 8-P phosphatase)
VDGVLTDGGLYYGTSGEEIKRFDVQDGLAVVAARRAGLAVAVISGRASAAVTRRMTELGITEVHQGVEDKTVVLAALTARLGLDLDDVAVMGDDLGDLARCAESAWPWLPPMRSVRCAARPTGCLGAGAAPAR